MNWFWLILRLEFGFYQFIGAERGVDKILNEFDLRAILIYMETKFGSSSY